MVVAVLAKAAIVVLPVPVPAELSVLFGLETLEHSLQHV
jgi:hypothetical protein